ncbi:hypothetical protein WG66_011680 [Moniliophthora roreri]|nr:hypothetical protein WG66_011680 [Moniliophthora roreri]
MYWISPIMRCKGINYIASKIKNLTPDCTWGFCSACSWSRLSLLIMIKYGWEGQ